MLTLIRASCGSGKTFAVEQKVAARAAEGKRSAILFPTNVTAIETTERLRAAGAKVLRRASPHTFLDEKGEPICIYPTAALIAGAGMGVRRELCVGLGDGYSPCVMHDTCPAANGRDEDPGALVFVATHPLLREAVDWVDPAGLLVLDEPPPVVETTRIGSAQTDAARYAGKYLYQMVNDVYSVLLDAIDRGIVANTSNLVTEIVRAGAQTIHVPSDLIGRLFSGFKGDHPTVEEISEMIKSVTRDDGRPTLSPYGLAAFRSINAKPMNGSKLEKARANAIEGKFSAGAKVVAALTRALLSDTGKIASSIVNGELILVEEAAHLIAALNRIGPTVMLDATVNLEILEKFVAGIRVVDLHVEDGAPIERVWLRCASASRRGWFDHGERPRLKNLVGPLRRALEIVCEDLDRRVLGIVTFKGLLGPIEAAWREDRANLPPAAKEIAAILDPWRARKGAELRLLYYGNVRGRNDLADVDALVTLGDPWSHKLDMEATCATLGIDFEQTYRRECAAELAQAVGRIRAPRRTRKAIVVVVGSLTPDGWTGENTRIEELTPGRPRTEADSVRGDVLRAWREQEGVSRRELARRLGIPETTLRRCEERCAEIPTDQREVGKGVSAQPAQTTAPPTAAAPKLLSREAGAHVMDDPAIAIAKNLPAALKAALPPDGKTYQGEGHVREVPRTGAYLGRGRGLCPSTVKRALGITKRAMPHTRDEMMVWGWAT